MVSGAGGVVGVPGREQDVVVAGGGGGLSWRGSQTGKVTSKLG